jgi:hypothetical protein
VSVDAAADLLAAAANESEPPSELMAAEELTPDGDPEADLPTKAFSADRNKSGCRE